jgi:class 3 adenylate cyclase
MSCRGMNAHLSSLALNPSTHCDQLAHGVNDTFAFPHLARQKHEATLCLDMQVAASGGVLTTQAARAAGLRERLAQAGSQVMPLPLDELTLLFRGLRLKCGIDYGSVSCSVHATLCRPSYRGRVMNRSSRIAGLCKTGQVG